KLKDKTLDQLLIHYGEELLGKRLYEQFGAEFPLLIKFIDARKDLSVQVHPNDQIAGERHDSFGKTEMWYILQADEDARINVGFNRSLGKEEYLKILKEGRIEYVLNFEKVKQGDSFFINTGLVHAIGGGVLLAEIQQTSDITYRIYDWDRKDAQGNSRELHNELAVDAIDFEKKEDFRLSYSKEKNSSSTIASCRYFTTNFLLLEGDIEKNYSTIDSFVIYICTEGSAEISINGNSEVVEKGQTLLIPAENKKVKLFAEHAELLEVYIN
ncbi:MAG TPA: type I phosphomannose isomerase catalytic subunit, partial [Salinimicrobium sp.]|nr:type I phosphomannose isomerase catalytic subunit [Salinimicrobium sp.]